MNEKLKELDAEIAGLLAEAETLVTRSASALTPDDNQRFEQIESEVAQLRDRRNLMQRAVTAAGNPRAQESGTLTVPNFNVTRDPWTDRKPFNNHEELSSVRDGAQAALERSLADAPTEVQTRISRLASRDADAARMVTASTDPAYTRAFAKLLADPVSGRDRFTDDERAAFTRAMTLSTVTGVLVPAHLDPAVMMTNDGTANPFRRVGRVVTGITNVWQGVSSAGVTASWDAEAAEVSDDAPAFSNPTVTAYKGAAFIPLSIESYEDLVDGAGTDELMAAFADAKDRLEATAFTTGNGTSQPRGLVTALDANTNAEVANTTSNTFGLADVYALYEALPARWRNDPSCGWLANVKIANDIRQFGTDSYSTETVNLTAPVIPAVLGKPIYEADDMDGTITAAAEQKILIVGALSRFVVYDRIGSQVELVPHLFHTSNNRPSGQRGFYFHWRSGSNSVTDTAFRILGALTNA